MGSLKDHFGAELQRVREAAGLSRSAFGALVGFHPETIKSYEKGRRTPTLTLAEKSDEVLDTKQMFTGLQRLAEAETTPFGELRENEQRASAIRVWDMRAIPGLLQTDRYASALLRDPVEVEARMQRQGVFAREERPYVHAIIPEGLLYIEFGGPFVLREQLEHLIRPDAPWTLQVMPDQAGSYIGSDGPLILLEFPGDEPPIAFLDSRNRGTVVDDQERVSELWQAWEGLIADALSPTLSREMIEEVIRELPEA